MSMATATVYPAYFSTREEAILEICKHGWWPMAWMDKPAASYQAHFHVGDESLYMIDGVLEFTDQAAGITHVLRSGDKLLLPARVVHSVRSKTGATYILGLSVLSPFDEHFIPVERA